MSWFWSCSGCCVFLPRSGNDNQFLSLRAFGATARTKQKLGEPRSGKEQEGKEPLRSIEPEDAGKWKEQD